ncbi:MAG: hypothetical protein IJO70_05455 [Lachnospiraceae bacterium]|nr:hypothetical protein [Lachnospiraceae bacterium]
MEYDCTKPLGDSLEEYLGEDLKNICIELSLQGIVYEHQFNKLWSMVCKMNAHELSKLFTKKTQLCIGYAYDKKTCNFVFYDMDVYNADKAIKLSVIYQTKKYNY